MERTTERFDGRVGRNGCRKSCYTCNGVECAYIYHMIDRLAAYEDTGMTPEEITGLCSMNERAKMADLLRLEEYQDIGTIDHLRELAQAEKDRRLVTYMPGDKVYDRFGTPWVVESSEIHLIGAEIKHLYRCGHPGTDDYCALYEEEIRAREEAEAALKKREETDNAKN